MTLPGVLAVLMMQAPWPRLVTRGMAMRTARPAASPALQ